MVTSKGYGKRSSVEEYRIQSRGGVGIITQKTTDKVGIVVGTKKVSPLHELILSTDQGQVILKNIPKLKPKFSQRNQQFTNQIFRHI